MPTATSPNILGALVYLRLTSLRNALVSRFKRLKQPKYMVGALVGAAYIYFVFLRRLRSNRSSAAFADAMPSDLLAIATTIGALIVLIIVLMFWIWPRDRASLSFSEAEIAFLFPAPVSRTSLIHYRLASAQTGIFFTALMGAFFSGGAGFLQGSFAIRIVGWWIIVATLSLHIIGSSFAITRLLDRGITTLRRQLLTVGSVTLVVSALAIWLWRQLPAPTADNFANFGAITRYLADVFASGPLPWLLLPAKAIIRPLLATDWQALLLALGPALLVYVAHYFWVLRSAVSFEESSIARAEKRAAKVAAMRAGKARVGNSAPKARRAPFDLARVRRPELAFLWKNLLSTAGFLRPRTALIAAAIIVIGCKWLAGQPDYQGARYMVGIVALMTSAYLLFLGPVLARQDLRNDLMNADILKTYPLRGWQIVAGQILAPIAIVSVLLWLMLLTATLSFQPRRMQWLTPDVRTGVAVGLALFLPLLCAIQLLVANAAVVLFPLWSIATAGRTGTGIDVMGQRIFFLAGQIFTVLIALVPAAIVSGAVYAVLQWTATPFIAIALAVASALAVLVGEVCLGTWWLGGRFERFDLSAELRP